MARYLVVAHQTAQSDSLAQALKAHTSADPAPEFVLLVPATPLRHLLLRYEGDAETIAARNLDLARESLEAAGLRVVRGSVGDPAPLVAIDNELRQHAGEYAGIFISTFPSNISRWLRLRLPLRVQRRFGLPVTHLVGRLQRPEAGGDWIEEQLLAVERGEDIAAEVLERTGFWEGVLKLVDKGGRRAALARQVLLRMLPQAANQARISAAVAALTNERARVRSAAMEVLARETDPAVEAAARQALSDSDPQVRMLAIQALENQRTPSAAATLVEALRTLADSRSALVANSIVRLGSLAIPALTEALNSRSVDVRWRATHCLARMQTPEALPALLRAFYDSAPSVAWAAAEGLAHLGPSVSAEVVKSLLEPGGRRPPLAALRRYAELAAPRQAFRPLLEATALAGAGHALPLAAAETLQALEKRRE